MNVTIEQNADTGACKVKLNDQVVTFSTFEDAQAYVAKLEERIGASAHAFTERAQSELP